MQTSQLRQLQRGRDRVRMIDVRTASEFENAHIAGAYNVPLDQLAEHAPDLRDASGGAVILVCQSGQRAQKAEGLLRDAGMPNVHVLEGGMRAWLADALPITRRRARVSLERQVRIAAGALVTLGSLAALIISPLWAALPAAIGGGLILAGLTDTCGMGMLLARLPYNRAAISCDTESIVRRFIAEEKSGGS
jgi:rhodanese-related sulfurtransferase